MPAATSLLTPYLRHEQQSKMSSFPGLPESPGRNSCSSQMQGTVLGLATGLGVCSNIYGTDSHAEHGGDSYIVQ